MDELISRQALVDAYVELMADIPTEEAGWERLFKALCEAIHAAPRFTMDRKKGAWVKHKQKDLVHWDCSECGIAFLDDKGLDKLHYCPNCGAVMTGRKERAVVAYIAGKITGDKDYRETFEGYAETLRQQGYIVLNPAELPEGMEPGDYMRICVPMIYAADVVCFLPGYTESKGAMLELEFCKYIRKPYVLPPEPPEDEE